MEFGIITGILLLAFIGLIVWAYSKKRKSHFDQAAQLALDESDRTVDMRGMERNS